MQKFFKSKKQILSKLSAICSSRPYLVCCLAVFLYLITFQPGFVFSGDAWAESYAEYLDEAIRFGWSEVIAQSWVGYLTILPSALSKLYVSFGGPLGYADYYFRVVVIAFATLTISITAAKFNRQIIASDTLRILLAVSCIAVIGDVASFSFINIWYIALVPLLLFCLNPLPIPKLQEAGIGVLGVLVSLTKPFVILLPLLVLRMLRSKQYVGAGLILVATAYQSYQTLSNDRLGLAGTTNYDLKTTVVAVATGAATEAYKLLQIVPAGLWAIILMLSILSALLILLWYLKGFFVAASIGLFFTYSVYVYVLAPDSPIFTTYHDFMDIYDFGLKTQRELLINAGLLVALVAVLDGIAQRWPELRVKKRAIPIKPLSILVGLILLVVINRPIDVNRPGVASSSLEPFRTQLNEGQPTCVPLAPNALFTVKSNWSFGYGGECKTLTHDLNIFVPDYGNMATPLNNTVIEYNAKYYRLNRDQLQAVVIPIVSSSNQASSVKLRLGNNQSFEAKTRPNLKDKKQFITFNVSAVTPRDTYKFSVSADKGIKTGKFKNNKGVINYAYFLETDK